MTSNDILCVRNVAMFI